MGKDDFLAADDACGSSIRSSLCSGCTKPPPLRWKRWRRQNKSRKTDCCVTH
ncbi:hypothetical protein K435DRAFT_787378, partial [Dendrothele bispora CBS 962.96]